MSDLIPNISLDCRRKHWEVQMFISSGVDSEVADYSVGILLVRLIAKVPSCLSVYKR